MVCLEYAAIVICCSAQVDDVKVSSKLYHTKHFSAPWRCGSSSTSDSTETSIRQPCCISLSLLTVDTTNSSGCPFRSRLDINEESTSVISDPESSIAYVVTNFPRFPKRWEKIACAVRHNRIAITVEYGCVSLRMRFFSQNFGTIKRILPGSSSPSHREGPGTEVENVCCSYKSPKTGHTPANSGVRLAEVLSTSTIVIKRVLCRFQK